MERLRYEKISKAQQHVNISQQVQRSGMLKRISVETKIVYTDD